MEDADRLTHTIPFGERIFIAIEIRRKIFRAEGSIDLMETGHENGLGSKNFSRSKVMDMLV